ncbi:hypothetical protein FPRO05_12306 [Fusarium proliferatum]|uniref:Uncharacterized protein n=1 Tax=Gibberella intermedia TaxID=948311 RepID=A0A365N4F9_GIBIN|nr:hypothetical protein FPRO05_12306 [Fusarium proliferatum]
MKFFEVLMHVITPNNKQHTSDCKAFLVTTITPKKATIYKTTTITKKTPTVRKSITATSTSSAIATSVSSVVQTVTENIVVTRTVEQTKFVTEQATATITTQDANVNPPFKHKRSAPRIPEYLDNICTNSAQYSSACSRIGVTSKTVNGPRVTVVSKIIRVKIPRASTIRTTVSTTWVTQTVKTTVVLKTYSTEEVTKTIDVVTNDVAIATKTVTETTTKTEIAEPLQTVKLFAVGSDDPDLALSGFGFSFLEASQGTTFYVDFTSDSGSLQKYSIHKGTGEVKALNGPGGAVGKSASYNFYPGSGNPYGAVMIQGQGAPPLVCKVVDGATYNYLQCKFGNSQIADFWTCNGRLLLVAPGYDLSSCVMDGNSYTGYPIPLIRVTSN